LRNREAIAEVLARELPERGTVLEIAAGSGEHAVFFAARFGSLTWLPTDPAADARASIAEYRADFTGTNLLAPLPLDAAEPDGWPVDEAAAILCINMIHISPWAATQGLFRGAARLLGKGGGGPLICYGPFLEDGVETATSNLAFGASLLARNTQWGLRRAEDLDSLAAAHGLARAARHAMPANNLSLVFRPV
jgi:hypothetical protein